MAENQNPELPAPPEQPRSYGPLTEEEEKLYAEVQEMEAVVKLRQKSLTSARNELVTKNSYFWTTIERRLHVFDVPLTLDEKNQIVEKTFSTNDHIRRMLGGIGGMFQ